MDAPAEARHYERLDGGRVCCYLCPHNCVIQTGKTGICGVRRNIDGTLMSEIYGQVSSMAMDPIEKKPLYHFHPGSSILSIGTKGCNLKCPYCQNWHISQDLMARTSYRAPGDIVRTALKEGSVGIAYTYSEPVIWFEYVMDTSMAARKEGLANVMVTNGFITRDPLEELLGVVDAMNIDLKSFREDTYRKVQKGKLEDVKNAIITAHAGGCHVEVTTLVVTGLNDDMDEMKDIMKFIASVDRRIPWHISRYYPNYNYSEPATGVDFITDVYREARGTLDYVYCGNVPHGRGGSDTECPACKTTVIRRAGYSVSRERLKNGMCPRCGADLNIVM